MNDDREKDTYEPGYYKLPTNAADIGDAVEHLPFWVANAIKYLYRVDGKGSAAQNLGKAQECIQREIVRRMKWQTNPHVQQKKVQYRGTSVQPSWPSDIYRQEQLRQDSPSSVEVRSQGGSPPANLPSRGD